MRSLTIPRIAGTGFRRCGPTRHWSSRPSSRRRRATPGGPPTPPSRILRHPRTGGRARASRSAPSLFSDRPAPYRRLLIGKWAGYPLRARIVIPAEVRRRAGIRKPLRYLDSRLRGNDDEAAGTPFLAAGEYFRRLPCPDLGELGAATDALGQGEGHLAGVVVGHELDRHTPAVEPNRVFCAAVDLEFEGLDRGTVDLYAGLFAALDPHLLELARIGAHHCIRSNKIVRPRVGRMNRGGCRDRALRRGDHKRIAARLAFDLDRTVAFV